MIVMCSYFKSAFLK